MKDMQSQETPTKSVKVLEDENQELRLRVEQLALENEILREMSNKNADTKLGLVSPKGD